MKRILVNTGSNVTVVVVKLVITFVMTPVFVHNLGNYDYGIWEIMTAVLGYMGLLDIGMKPAISRFSAKYLAEKNQGKLQELYSTSFLFLAIVGRISFRRITRFYPSTHCCCLSLARSCLLCFLVMLRKVF
jgi:O-antigen/teichoic acid export membrane protein